MIILASLFMFMMKDDNGFNVKAHLYHTNSNIFRLNIRWHLLNFMSGTKVSSSYSFELICQTQSFFKINAEQEKKQ